MSVSNVSFGIGPQQADWRSTVKQGKQDFSQLLGALQSGDLSSAQQAYAAMQQMLPGFQTAQTATSSGTDTSVTSAAVAVGTDFSALGTALSSGSLSAAQDAVTKLQQDALTYRQARQQAGNLTSASASSNSVQPGSTNSANLSNPVATDSSTSPYSSDLSALGQALQSGNLSSAQDAFAKLQQDLQSTQQGQGLRHHHHHHHHMASGAQNPTASYIANSALGSTTPDASSTSNSVSVSA